VLTAEKSGTANAISITNGLAAGEVKDALDGMTQARAAQNAEFTMNGVLVSSDSNSVDSAITGVTLDLAKEGASKITVSRDTAQAQGAVQTFVKAYNDLQSTVKALTSYDASTQKASVLNGDYGTTSLITSIRGMLGQAVTGAGQFRQLSDIGVSFQKDGTLSLDSSKLSDALKTSANDVAALFGRRGTSTDALVTYNGATTATKAGDWHVDVTSAATRAAATAANAAAATTVIDGTNDSLTLTIDGTTSGTLKLAQGSYTPAQLATLVQNTINGASEFSSKGVSVLVTVDGNGKLQIESQAYGSTSKVSDVQATALGFDGTETANGADVAGTFTLNGTTYTATGSGQRLNGPTGTPAEGLSLNFTGDASQLGAGDEGVLTLSEGMAVRLSRFANEQLGTTGVVASRTDGLNKAIKDIATRKESLESRMDRIEKQLRAQYVALDTLLGQMNTQSSFLSQQLAALPSNN
jgi:flagellar hook-associated protein 2